MPLCPGVSMASIDVAVDDEGVAGAEQGHGFGDEGDEMRRRRRP